MELFFDTCAPKDLLCRAVREVWGLAALPAIARTAHGKPYFPDRPELHFNLSHSGDLVACAVDCAPVGIDIEMIRPHHPRLAQRVCSPAELDWVMAQPDPDRALLTLWTKKEARVKWEGCGLTVPLRGIRVPFEDDAVLDGLRFCALSGTGWVGTVCGTSAPGKPRVTGLD